VRAEGPFCCMSVVVFAPDGVHVAMRLPVFGVFVTVTSEGPESVVLASDTQIVWLPEGPHVRGAAATGPEGRAAIPEAIAMISPAVTSGHRRRKAICPRLDVRLGLPNTRAPSSEILA